MQDADQKLRDGDVEGARAALVEAIRAAPNDERTRMFLFQLLCVTGEWSKARSQLQALAQLSPEAQMLSAAYGQALEAETARADVFAGRARLAPLISFAWADSLADAIEHYAKGDAVQGDTARDAAFELAADTPGELDGTRFEWLADADSRFGPSFEAIIGGRYGVVPFEAVARIESEGPRDLRDTVWYPVQLHFRQGQSVAAFMPARYPGSETASDPAERLGRATGWTDQSWGQAGSGQHLWMLSDGDERGLLSLRTLTFD